MTKFYSNFMCISYVLHTHSLGSCVSDAVCCSFVVRVKVMTKEESVKNRMVNCGIVQGHRKRWTGFETAIT